VFHAASNVTRFCGEQSEAWLATLSHMHLSGGRRQVPWEFREYDRYHEVAVYS
jgi:hypothetical protein